MEYDNDRRESRDLEMGEIELDHGIDQPKSVYSNNNLSTTSLINSPPPDYMNRSTASLFICFLWGIFAFRASNKTRKFNNMKAYTEATYYSNIAREHNQSALACFVVTFCILGIPFVVALATQGSITKYPSAREFFG